MNDNIKRCTGHNFTIAELLRFDDSFRNMIINAPGKLRVLQLPEGFDEIEENLFANTDVEKVIFPASVKTIY